MTEPIRTLILEDNPADAELVQFELEEAGLTFTPKVVVTEEDFVQSLQNFCPDLILSDYDLPKYNGSLALIEAKRSCPDTPFILVTGAVTEDRAIDILTQGAKDYVLKNRLQQRLVPAVRRALAEAEEHKARKKAEAELREAHRTLEEKVKIRTAELEAEMAERKKTEEALKDSEKRYRRLFEASKDGVLILDAYTGKVVDVNPFLMQLLGYSYDELCGKHIWEIGAFKDIAASKAAFKALQDSEYIRYEDLPLETRTAQPIAVEFVSNVYLVDHSKVIQCNIRDITKRKQAEEALRESEERFRALVTASSEVLYHMSPDWSEMYQLIGQGFLAKTEKPSRTWLQEYIHPDDQPYVTSVINEAIRTKSTFNLEHRVKRAVGSIGWTHSRAVPLMDKDGEVVEWFGAASDITERKQAEMALKERA